MEQTVNLQPHQQRVVEQEDMKKQYSTMHIYCDALESRIKRF